MSAKTWQPVDPIATGALVIPPEHRQAYGDACREAQIEGIAQTVVNMPTLAQRRRLIDKTPPALQQAVKIRVRELWNQTKKN